MSKYHYVQQIEEEALKNTLLMSITGSYDNVKPNGGAALDNCFIQIRNHQQDFCSLPDFRAGEFSRPSRVPTH